MTLRTTMKLALVCFLLVAYLAIGKASNDDDIQAATEEKENAAERKLSFDDIPGLTEDMLTETINEAKEETLEEEKNTPRDDQNSGEPESLQKAHYKRFVPELEPVRIGALTKERIVKKLAQKLSLTDAEVASSLEKLDDPKFKMVCQRTPPESKNNKVPRGCRKVDGRGNNKKNPDFGRIFTPLTRILPPDYADGVSKPRRATDGGELPNARFVSMTLFTDENHPSKHLSHMVMIFGQFVNHDTSLGAQPNTDCSKNCKPSGECFGIPIPKNDKAFRDRNRTCIMVKRDVPFCGSKAVREQLNTRTPFIDASAVYSELPDKFQSLRDPFDRALLIETPVHGRKNLLSKQKGGFCRSPDVVNKPCFVAGDVRVNENPGLLSMHTLWNRAHNRIAERLRRINRHWCPGKVFFEARKILGAIMQHITFKEYLPVILNYQTRRKFNLLLKRFGYFKGYSKCVNPSILNEFISAAFRFGHSQVRNKMSRFHKGYLVSINPALQMKDFFNPSFAYEKKGGIDSVVRGFIKDKAQISDRFFAKAITENLRRGPTDLADLAAINLQRAREHGIPGYNQYRDHKIVGLKKATSFDDLKKDGLMDSAKVAKLKEVYKHVNDIDLFVGGLFEKPVKNGVLGPTFSAIVAEQFRRMRVGDRFWYENPNEFTYSQLREIRKMSLARLICDNTNGIVKIPRRPLQSWQLLYKCSSLKKMNLWRWRDNRY